MELGQRDREIFFKCPRCASLFSTTKEDIERDKYTKGTLTRMLFGSRVSVISQIPKCTRCSTRLERISREEFDRLLKKPE